MGKPHLEKMTVEEFKLARIRLFAGAEESLKQFGRKVLDYCWSLDEFAVMQEWEGERDRLIVFGVPEGMRRRSDAKNYFGIYSIKGQFIKGIQCSIVFPKSEQEKLLKQFDPKKRLSRNSIGEWVGDFGEGDFEYLKNLIDAARYQRISHVP